MFRTSFLVVVLWSSVSECHWLGLEMWRFAQLTLQLASLWLQPDIWAANLCVCVCVCVRACAVCDRAVKPPFDNALSAGRPAVAPGYRSQLGNAEIETMRRRGRWRGREDDDSAIRRWGHERDRETKSMNSGLKCLCSHSVFHIWKLFRYPQIVHQVNSSKYD